MNNIQQQIEIVDIIQKNERKSRLRLIFWIILCLTLGLLTTYFGYESQLKSKLLNEQAEVLKIQAEAFEASRKDVTAAKDSLRALLSRIENQVQDPIMKEQIKKEISETDVSGYIVYIQEFGPNGGEVSKQIQAALQQKGFLVPEIEKMKNEFTKSRITYFHDEDFETSAKMYEEIKKIILSFDPNFNIEQLQPKKSNIKAPSKQIEVWIKI